MKKIISLFVLFSIPATIVFGCSCANFLYTTNDWYVTSDFVGIVKVTSILKGSDTKRRSYIAKIEPYATFKGKAPDSLVVAGAKNGPDFGASCEITVKAGEKWLVAISKNSLGWYPLSYCSYASKLDNSNGENVSSSSNWQAVKQFQFLERNVHKFHRNFLIGECTKGFSDYLNQYDGQSFNKDSVQYLLIFDTDFNIKKVKVLRGFSAEFNKKLIAFLKQNTKWDKRYQCESNFKLKNETKLILRIRYNREEKKLSAPLWL